MGKILHVRTHLLMPTEEKFNESKLKKGKKLFDEKTLKRIFFQRYFQGKNKKTPIFPVRECQNKEGMYFILDGHNRAIIDDLFEDESLIFVAQSPKDKIVYKKLPARYQIENKNLLKEMNENIVWRFNQSLENYEKEGSIKCFQELRRIHPYLADIKTAKEYFEKLK